MIKTLMIAFVLVLCSTITKADWQKMNSHPSTWSRDIMISGDKIYSATTTGIFQSTNSTASWEPRNAGLSNAQAIQCYQIISAGGSLFIATEDGIYRSTDNAASWVKKSVGIIVGGGAIYEFCESIYENGGVLFTGAHTGIYRSTDLGESWQQTNINGTHIKAKGFLLYNGIIFAARESINPPGSYKSTDNGLTWQTFSVTGSLMPAITFFADGANLWCGTIHGAWLSTNSGVNWTSKSNGLSPDPYNSSFLKFGGVLLTSLKFGGSGMFRSFNNGELWVDFMEGLPFIQSIDELILFGDKILAATSGGIYQRSVSELTGIQQVSSEVPQSFRLEQNYPNPFNPSTKIRFSIPQNGHVKLTVIDPSGAVVAELVNGKLEAGTYEADFPARTGGDGSGFSSGIYFYTLSAGSFNKTGKMVLVK